MCPGALVRLSNESIGARVVCGADRVLVKICSFSEWYLKCPFRNQTKTCAETDPDASPIGAYLVLGTDPVLSQNLTFLQLIS